MTQALLTLGISSSALFDLTESDKVFRDRGAEAYTAYQDELLEVPLDKGVAFPFIQRMLSLNTGMPACVEVIVLSKNSPETGLRVMRSVEYYGLAIKKAAFRTGMSPYGFMPAFGMSLFLSADEDDVRAAITEGHPAGQILSHASVAADTQADDGCLRIAFDFDGVLAGDSAEQEFIRLGPQDYTQQEASLANVPIEPGPLMPFLEGLNKIQRLQSSKNNCSRSAGEDVNERRGKEEKALRISLITARPTPAHERAINTLSSWGLHVDDAFFLGGASKTQIINELRPHIYFDDQLKNLDTSALVVPTVHIPFGVQNR